jgi:hypothetical protein
VELVPSLAYSKVWQHRMGEGAGGGEGRQGSNRIATVPMLCIRKYSCRIPYGSGRPDLDQIGSKSSNIRNIL